MLTTSFFLNGSAGLRGIVINSKVESRIIFMSDCKILDGQHKYSIWSEITLVVSPEWKHFTCRVIDYTIHAEKGTLKASF